ncbi:MAG: UDP-glucose 4-epimerase [Phycisphaerae bacterium]|nr:UDP-glucose 4-epimerase [Phycisphaerae bacterium]
MRIFVTGGAGYVGSHCVKRLLAAGHEVVVYDSLANGHRQAVDPRAGLVVGDLGDAALLGSTLAGGRFDAVMHFAAWLDVGESVREPLKYYRNNVALTIGLLEAMQRTAVRRIVFSSTCATYGEPDQLPLVETMRQEPINPYGRTKLAIEWLLRDCGTAWGLGSVSLRYFNASGAAADGSIGEDHKPETHLIPIVLQVALGQRSGIKVFGNDYPTPDGTCVRDYIHVDDLAEVHLRAVESIQAGVAEQFNVGTGTGHSVMEVIETARAATGHAIPAEVVARRPGDPPALYADASLAKRRFGWEPRYRNLREVIETAWRWHRAHPDGYR